MKQLMEHVVQYETDIIQQVEVMIGQPVRIIQIRQVEIIHTTVMVTELTVVEQIMMHYVE